MNFSERLKHLRQSRGLSQEALADILKIPRSSIAHYENADENNIRLPRKERLEKIADFFGVSVDYLLGRTEDPKPKPAFDVETEFMEIDNPITIPLLGRIAAGAPILADEHIEGWLTISNIGKYKPGELFALRVEGDSMIGSRIYPGDIVIVRIQNWVNDGEIAVVNVDGEAATLKRVKRVNGQYILFPDNPKYQPIVVNSDQARICGKVIRVMFDPNNQQL